MKPKLTAENAVIKTATVEVKTLTISGKQVTLAVFRQIPHEGYPAKNPDPQWPIWGRVNYHTSACDYAGQHKHIVWQKGSELKQCIIGEGVTQNMWTYCTQYIDQLFIAV